MSLFLNAFITCNPVKMILDAWAFTCIKSKAISPQLTKATKHVLSQQWST